jgi:hypothetical protein
MDNKSNYFQNEYECLDNYDNNSKAIVNKDNNKDNITNEFNNMMLILDNIDVNEDLDIEKPDEDIILNNQKYLLSVKESRITKKDLKKKKDKKDTISSSSFINSPKDKKIKKREKQKAKQKARYLQRKEINEELTNFKLDNSNKDNTY